MNRRLYFSLFVTIMATALGASLVLPLLPVYAQSLGATGLDLGLIFSSFALARSVFLPAVGNLSDKWGRRPFMLWGLMAYTLIAIGFSLSSSVFHLIICRLIQGAGAAMVIPVARAYVGDLSKPGEEGRVMGHFNMAFFGGLALGPWMGGLLKDIFGMNSAFYSMGALSLFGFVLALFTLPKTDFQTRNNPKHKASYLQIMRIPSLLAMFLFRFGSIIGVGMNWTFMPLYGHEELHLSGTKIGILVSLTVIMTTLLQPYFGRLSDRINRPWMAFWGGALASLCLFGVPFCHTFMHLFVLNLLLGTAIGLYMPPLMAMAVDLGRRIGYMTKVMSLLEMAFSFGMVLGPLMAGLIKESLGLGAIFMVGGAIGLGTCFIFMVLILKSNSVVQEQAE